MTAVGALRGLLGVPGVEENVGMVGIHHRGRFYEFLPNLGRLSWDVDPWGRWRIEGCTRQYETVVEAWCEAPGTPLRAPTMDEGLAPFCRDSFCGQVGSSPGRQRASLLWSGHVMNATQPRPLTQLLLRVCRCAYACGRRAAGQGPHSWTAPARAVQGRWKLAAAPGFPAGSRKRRWRSP